MIRAFAICTLSASLVGVAVASAPVGGGGHGRPAAGLREHLPALTRLLATSGEGERAPHGRCLAEASTSLVLGTSAAVDEIRVTATGAGDRTARVRIAAGGFGRVVRAAAGGDTILRFTPPLAARSFQVAVEREPGTREPPCLRRVVLLASGREVGTLAP